jgi:hypothetical protein
MAAVLVEILLTARAAEVLAPIAVAVAITITAIRITIRHGSLLFWI